jgi:hypothetical protein
VRGPPNEDFGSPPDPHAGHDPEFMAILRKLIFGEEPPSEKQAQ